MSIIIIGLAPDSTPTPLYTSPPAPSLPPTVSPGAATPPAPSLPPTVSPGAATPPAPSLPPNVSPGAATGTSTNAPPPLGTYSPPPTESSSGPSVPTGLVVGIAIGGILVLALLSLVFIYYKKKKRRDPPSEPEDGPPKQWQHNAPPPRDHIVSITPKPSRPPAMASGHSPSPQPAPAPPFMSSSGGSGSNYSKSSNTLPPPSPGMALGFSKSTFTYEELATATDGFSDANLLGQGGFGYVHRGVLPNGKEVAIKQLKAGSGQGEREFQAEVEIISRVHHKHLVSLVGYCMIGAERLLVYEFVPNNTLEFHLHAVAEPEGF